MMNDVERLAGYHSVEHDDLGPFVWTEGTFHIRTRRAARFAVFKLCYYGSAGTLTVRNEKGQTVDEVQLLAGWQPCALRLDAPAGATLAFEVAPLVSVAGDSRELGLMLRETSLFDDESSFTRMREAQLNMRLNQLECAEGRAVLASSPPAIRVNLEARCNIPETSQACAYCAWDWAKESERGSPSFTLTTLDDLGNFYRQATEVNDCCIGEPTMNKQFGAIVSRIDHDGKQMSLTTNGQLLTPKRRQEMLGKNLILYVSIDSATAAGYARYRNDRFDDVIANVTALCREKKAHDDLPRVFASFIAMRSNVHELPAYFALMREVGVDEIKVRTLYLDDNLPSVTVNNGYHFDYAAEVLTMNEMAQVAREARSLAREHGVSVYLESEQFPLDVARPGAPLCNEPWRTLYVLRRGIMPCCYATRPIATWDEQQQRPLDEFLAEVFNGPAYREIRTELAAGRLSDYCRQTPSCPILQDMQRQGLVTVPHNQYQRRAHEESAVSEERRLPLVPLEVLKPVGCDV